MSYLCNLSYVNSFFFFATCALQALPILLEKFQAEPRVVDCLLPLIGYLQPKVIGLAPSKVPFTRLLQQLKKLLLDGSSLRAPAVCASLRYLLSGCDHSRVDDVGETLQEVRFSCICAFILYVICICSKCTLENLA